ncbi:MAG: hypothetical protein HZC55_05325 [Verrucomicrobia bacterium]|jgi:hypothetical protein|nr:hypothetical protein [Verrucomicrobiota bacterium]
MRLLKIVLAGLVTAVAMAASLLFALGVAIIGLLVYGYLRLRGKPASVRFGRNPAPPPPAQGEVIDIKATEVPARRLDS